MSPDDRLIPLDRTNALEDLKPAGDLSSPAVATSQIDSPVSVANLKASGVPIDWHEAVAIVQAACRAIIESGDLIGPARLEPTAVLLDATGCISVRSKDPRSAPGAIKSLGDILSGILPSNDVMLLGVRVVSKATSSPPVYRSLEEFSNALAYFERPNRAQLLQAIYDRWRGAAARPVTDVPGPIAESMVLDRSAARARNRLRYLRVTSAAMIVLVAIGGIGVWAYRSRPMWIGSVLKVPTKAVDAISFHIAAVLAPPRATEPVPPPAPVARPTVNRSRAPRTAAARPVLAERAADGHSDVVSRVDGNATRVDFDSTSVSAITPEVPSPRAGGGDLKTTPDSVLAPVTYNVSDVDVVPPSAVFPQFLSVLGSKTHREALPIIEVVVNEQGTVDAVKAQRAPRSLGEYILMTTTLSAVKSWRFQPALKDDQTVRYRALLVLAIH